MKQTTSALVLPVPRSEKWRRCPGRATEFTFAVIHCSSRFKKEMRGMIAVGAIISGANPIPPAEGPRAGAKRAPPAGTFARAGQIRDGEARTATSVTTHEGVCGILTWQAAVRSVKLGQQKNPRRSSRAGPVNFLR
jgi:hypothetical protein